MVSQVILRARTCCTLHGYRGTALLAFLSDPSQTLLQQFETVRNSGMLGKKSLLLGESPLRIEMMWKCDGVESKSIKRTQGKSPRLPTERGRSRYVWNNAEVYILVVEESSRAMRAKQVFLLKRSASCLQATTARRDWKRRKKTMCSLWHRESLQSLEWSLQCIDMQQKLQLKNHVHDMLFFTILRITYMHTAIRWILHTNLG